MCPKQLKPGWKVVKFGDVVKNANLTERDPVANGIERVVGLEHLDPENLHIRRWNDAEDGTSFTRKFVPGQTLFGKRRAYQRKVAYAEFEGICSGDILTFEPKDKNTLLPELLPFICRSDAFFDHALGTSAGSLSPRTSWKALKDYEFSLAPIDEQKRIAEILWAADEDVEARMSMLSQLQTVYEVVAIELFRGDDLEDEKKQSKLWSIPNSWEVKLLSEVTVPSAPIRYGIVQVGLDADGGVPTLAIKNLSGDFKEGIHRTSDKVEAKYKNSRVRPGDVLLSIKATVGEVAEVPEWFEGNISRDLARIRLDETVLPAYLVHLFRTKIYQRYVNKYIVGSTRKEISIHVLRNFLIPVPSVSEQKRILSALVKIENRIQDTEDSVRKAQLLLTTINSDFFH